MVRSKRYVGTYDPRTRLTKWWLQVMPYLSRRAIENKSVLGEGASEEERQLAAQEIKKRIFG